MYQNEMYRNGMKNVCSFNERDILVEIAENSFIVLAQGHFQQWTEERYHNRICPEMPFSLLEASLSSAALKCSISLDVFLV
jgi:hypothetical protein